MDFADTYAEMASRARFDDLPPHAVDMTKRCLLDALGVAAAGSASDEAAKTVQLVREWGGKAESSLLFCKKKLPAPSAVFANSVMIHALDFDDTHDGAVVHAYVTALPAALAVSEQLGTVNGKDFILALNLGLDLTCRLGLSIGSAAGFETRPVHFIRSAVCGCFGAAVTAGKLMGFSKPELVNALGIVLSQVGGTRQVVVDGAMTKRFQPAFAAAAGVLSARLVQLGVSGCRDVFEGSYGFFNSYWGGNYSREELTKDLGSRFEGSFVSLKPFPCCRYNHGAIDAVLRCVQDNGIAAADIENITVHLPSQRFYDVVSKPFAVEGNPSVYAQFSIPYTVASAVLDGGVFLKSFSAETVLEEKRKKMAEKVEVVTDLPVEDPKSLGPVALEIRAIGGGEYSITIENIKGSPDNPMRREDCIEKFNRCVQYAGISIAEEAVIETILSLEDVENVAVVSEMLA